MSDERRFASASVPSLLMTQHSLLTSGLTSLAANHFVAVLDAFAFVRIRLTQRADLRRRLADALLIGAGDGDVAGLRVDGDVDPFRNRKSHRMRIPELEHHLFPLHLGAVSDADDVELTLEAFAH